MTTTPPPTPSYPPTEGLATTWSDLARSRQAAPGTHTVVVMHHAPAPAIHTLPADHHNAVDWPRVRRAVRTCLTPASVTGIALSPLWARVALPLADEHGLGAVVSLGFMTAVWTGVALATGRIPRSLTTVVLVAVAAGTLELAPAAIAAHLMEN